MWSGITMKMQILADYTRFLVLLDGQDIPGAVAVDVPSEFVDEVVALEQLNENMQRRLQAMVGPMPQRIV